VLGRSQATEEELTTTLVSIEAAPNSRPITQDTEEALTPAHFFCGAKLTTLRSKTEPQREGNLNKIHQKTKEWPMTFGDVGKRNTSWSLDPSIQSLNQRGIQGKSESETSSYSKRIAAPDICGRKPGRRR